MRISVFGLLFVSLSLIALSCEGSGENPAMAVPKTAGTPGAGPVSAAESAQKAESARRMLLVRGNQWVNGIPGFGANGFFALKGEYQLLPRAENEAGNNGAGDFFVYLTKESLYFSADWQIRQQNRALQQNRTLQRSGEDGFLAAVTIDDGRGSSWIAVFLFPLGIEETGLGADAFDQLIRAWTGRFLYFYSLSRTIGELSLPAIVEF